MRNVTWSKSLQRYVVEINAGPIRRTRYRRTLSQAIEVAQELRRDLFAEPTNGA